MGHHCGLGAGDPRRRGCSLYGYFFPNESAAAAGKYTDQQRSDAKKHICETFKIVDRAVVRNSHLKNPDNGGPIGALSVATA